MDAQILAGHTIQPGEKVHRHGTRCLAGRKLSQHQRQMIAANLLAPGAKDPLEHYLISWKSNECPSVKQIEETLDIFAEEMGYQHCQIIWATHSNTANYHLHIVVNRVDLVRQRVVSPGDGWEIDPLHQVTALVEDAQGWESEPNAIYVANGGEVRERATGKIMRRADGSRAGCDTRKLVAPEKGSSPEYAAIAQDLRSSETWQDLHNRLAKHDASYHTKGSGAEIVIGNVRMKATSFGREFSYRRMVSKLGEYTPDPLRERDPFEDYLAALRAERARVREALNEALAQLRARRQAIKKRARAREETYANLIAEARRLRCFDVAQAEVKKAFDRARATIAETQLRREAWYKAGCPNPPQVELPALVFTPNASRDRKIAEAHGLSRQEYKHGVEYRRADGGLAISDAGVVLVVDPGDRNAIAASLALAHQRGDVIPVFGPPAFQQVCREIAKVKGYALVLKTGETLYDPAVDVKKVVSSKSANARTSKSGAPSQQKRGNTEPKNLERTLPEKSVPSKTSTHFSRFPEPGRGDENDEFSDAVRLAATKGRGKGPGL
nr:relaxase/mobilization nuclease domain-containing protein [Qipengyuania vulgaris]